MRSEGIYLSLKGDSRLFIIVIFFDLCIEQDFCLETLEEPPALLRWAQLIVLNASWLKTVTQSDLPRPSKLVIGDKPVETCRETGPLGLMRE